MSNLVIDNQEKNELISQLRQENVKLQGQLEEITEKAQALKEKMASNKQQDDNDEPVLEFLNNTVEQMTIFQNKDIGCFKNVRLSKLQEEGLDDLSDSDSGEAQKQETSSKKYVKKLEFTVDALNAKLTRAKSELEKLRQENMSLQHSVDNHVFINEKLNQAYRNLKVKCQKLKKKGERRGSKVMVGQLELNLEDDSVVNELGSAKGEKMEATGGSSAYYPKQADTSDRDPELAVATQPTGEDKDKDFGGDISSICIAPFEDDQIKGGQFTDFIGEDSV